LLKLFESFSLAFEPHTKLGCWKEQQKK